jgi:hypothetical protein
MGHSCGTHPLQCRWGWVDIVTTSIMQPTQLIKYTVAVKHLVNKKSMPDQPPVTDRVWGGAVPVHSIAV